MGLLKKWEGRNDGGANGKDVSMDSNYTYESIASELLNGSSFREQGERD